MGRVSGKLPVGGCVRTRVCGAHPTIRQVDGRKTCHSRHSAGGREHGATLHCAPLRSAIYGDVVPGVTTPPRHIVPNCLP